ncbi:cobalamin biosynthesis protein [Mesorhizobium sp. NBSH29]|uniref:cobalamin biosynthesis protein n=1 Tax=Mesorhizobium sp. NBSH29 TaxID=2654249 RepID=UPI0018965464|nr:cobalamin biosynthesis protein [Mesorhizobium sp. NBSH29]
MIIAGIGCRRAAGVEEILAAVRATLDHYQVAPERLAALATGSIKTGEPGIIEAAKQLNVPLKLVSSVELTKADNHALSVSERSLELTGVGSLSEAAALGAGGAGARLLGVRLAVGSVTCALAQTDGEISR